MLLQGRAPQLTGPLDVSFVPDAPKTYAEFSALVSGRPAGDLPLIVARIRGANAAALAADNRRGLQVEKMGCGHWGQLVVSHPCGDSVGTRVADLNIACLQQPGNVVS